MKRIYNRLFKTRAPVSRDYTIKGKELNEFFDRFEPPRNNFYFYEKGSSKPETYLGEVLVNGEQVRMVIGFYPALRDELRVTHNKMIGFRKIASVEIQEYPSIFGDDVDITFESEDYYENKIKKYIELVANVSTIQDLEYYCKNINVLSVPDEAIQLLSNTFYNQPFIKSIDFKQDNVFFYSPPSPHHYTLEIAPEGMPKVFFNDGNNPLGGLKMQLKNDDYRDVWMIFITNPAQLVASIKMMSGGKRQRSRYTRRRHAKKRSTKRRHTRRY